MLTDIAAAWLYWRMMREITEARLKELQRRENERTARKVQTWTDKNINEKGK